MGQVRGQNAGRWLGVVTAFMCALAGGAVWAVLALRTGRDLGWFALACAAVIAWVMRVNGFRGSRLGAAFAAFCTLLSCAYAQTLLAVGDVAQALGFSLRDTILRIGADFALAVVKGRISPWDTATYVVAIVLAAWLVWRRGGQSQKVTRDK